MKKINTQTFLEYKFLSEPTISPSGKYTAFVVNTADIETNGYIANIYLRCNESGTVKQLTTQGAAKNITWIDDKTIIFPSTRSKTVKDKLAQGEELTQYYTIDVTGGEAQEDILLDVLAGKITKIGEDKYLVAANYDNNRPNLDGLSQAEKLDTLKKYKEIGYTTFQEIPFWGNGQGVINRKRNRLYIYDKNTKELTPITKPMFNVADFKANEDYIIYKGVEFDDVRPLFNGIYLYSFKDGSTKTLIEPKTFNVKGMILVGDKALIAGNDGSKYGMGEYGDLYMMNLATAEKTLITTYDYPFGGNSTGSDARFGGGKTVALEGDLVYFVSTMVNHSYIRTLNLKTGEMDTLTTEGAVDSFDVKDGKIVMVAFKGDDLGELYTVENKVETKVSAINDAINKNYTVVTPEPLTCVNRSGMDIYGYVMKPVGYVEGNSYPAILHVHGGPRTVFSSIFHNEMQVWANAGYFVIFANPRGGDGRGDEFADIRGKYGTIDYDDLMDYTDCALAAYPDIDSSRVGVTGGSYGGFMTNWIIGHTDRFKCACSQRSIANWTSFEGTTDIGYYFAVDQTAASFVDNYDKQWEQSPLKYADKAVTPTLFIHSDQDYRCWMVEALQMFTALKMHGTTAKLCLFKGENHELSRGGKPRNRVKRMDEILAWMDNYLK